MKTTARLIAVWGGVWLLVAGPSLTMAQQGPATRDVRPQPRTQVTEDQATPPSQVPPPTKIEPSDQTPPAEGRPTTVEPGAIVESPGPAVTGTVVPGVAAPVVPPAGPVLPPVPPMPPPRIGFHYTLIRSYGYRIVSVEPFSAAGQMCLEYGDVILAINGCPMTYYGADIPVRAEAAAKGGWVTAYVFDGRSGLLDFRTGNLFGPSAPPPAAPAPPATKEPVAPVEEKPEPPADTKKSPPKPMPPATLDKEAGQATE